MVLGQNDKILGQRTISTPSEISKGEAQSGSFHLQLRSMPGKLLEIKQEDILPFMESLKLSCFFVEVVHKRSKKAYLCFCD